MISNGKGGDVKEPKTTDTSDLAPVQPSQPVPQTLNLSKLSNLKQITFLGKMMAQSGMFSDVNRDPAKAIVKIIAGQEMGIPPVEAMRGLDIIQGEIAIGAGLMAAKIKGSTKYDYKVRQWDNEGCDIEFFERNEDTGKLESQGHSTFGVEDATAAGLIAKDNYRKWRRNMFFSRAMSNGQSIYCADIFQVGSVYTKEELDDRETLSDLSTGTEDDPALALPEPTVADAPGSVADDPDDEELEPTDGDQSTSDSASDDEPSPPQQPPATKTQINQIKMFLRGQGIASDDFDIALTDVLGAPAMNLLTQEQATWVLEELKAKAAGAKESDSQIEQTTTSQEVI